MLFMLANTLIFTANVQIWMEIIELAEPNEKNLHNMTN